MSLADPALFDELSASQFSAATDGAAAGSTRASVELAVVAPTYNERGNVVELLRRLKAGLGELRWEAIIVDDDSPDGTADLARAVGRTDPRVRVIRRVGRRGLSSACIEGMLSSNADYVAVIDADLQHDPALLALMLETIREHEADVVVASRYVDGASLGDLTAGRSRLSRWATRLTRQVSGVPITDPMSGYFLIRREVIEDRARVLSGRGFKILLDILTADDGALKVVETPFRFGVREHGESKLSARVMVDGLTLLFGRALSRNLPRRIVAFAGVGATGVGMQFLALSLLLAWVSLPFAFAQTLATLVAMASNFAMNNRLTFGAVRRTGASWFAGLIRFAAVCGLGVAFNVATAQSLMSAGWDWRLGAIAGIGVAALWNFAASALFVWSRPEDARA